ncbi:MAG: glycosyltransferase [Nitrospiraceae bacterium]|nr:MAG: glycosyltransferase [Nitrospiraceae bacterium]
MTVKYFFSSLLKKREPNFFGNNLMNSHIKLIVTIALKKEIDKDWFASRNIPVHSLEALRSGALKQDSGPVILIMITGAGTEASEASARWICDNLDPLFVINIGTCGVLKQKYGTGTWLRPHIICNEAGEKLEPDQRLPLPQPEGVSDIHLLLSARKESIGSIPDAWKKYDAVDMESYMQAKVFQEYDITFHCLKFGTDYSDEYTFRDFNSNITLFTEKLKEAFSFLDRDSEKITTVIPVHNRSQTIRRALDSVLGQSHAPEEIIVVDDCSTDETGDILKSYGKQITPVFLQKNSGPSRARNEGVQRAKTEWIAFLDSDDCWEKDKLKNQVTYLRKYPFYQIVQSEEVWIRNGIRVNPCKHHKKSEGWIWEQSLERCLISPSGVLVKKALLEKYGLFDETMPVCEDYDLWLRISRHHPVGLDQSFSVIKYGGHHDQLSRKFPAMDRFRVQSLVRLLEKEPNPTFRKKIIGVLAKKLKILIKGYEKRGKWEDAGESRRLLESLMKFA